MVDSNGIPTVGGIYNKAPGTVYVRTYYSGTPGIKIIGQGGEGGKGTNQHWGGDGGLGGTADTGGAGADGGKGGKGGTITLGNGQLAFSSNTQGDSSSGVYLESDGGSGAKGGGRTTGGGGGNGNDAGVITANGTFTIGTLGTLSHGVSAHSTGGRGGSGGDGFGLFYGGGGEAGKGGKGEWVTVTNSRALSTAGSDSTAIAALSQGGTGGRGGSAGSPIAALGMSGGSGAHGGNVTVNNSGTIIAGYAVLASGAPTSGTDPVCGNDTNGGGCCSHGIFAQSVGGGVAGTAGLGPGYVVGSIWGSIGGDGYARAVTVDYTGNLTTSGDGATGIFAQSSSGQVQPPSAEPVTVTIHENSSIKVKGTDASAIVAQSVWLQLFQQGQYPVPVGASPITVTMQQGSEVQGAMAVPSKLAPASISEMA